LGTQSAMRQFNGYNTRSLDPPWRASVARTSFTCLATAEAGTPSSRAGQRKIGAKTGLTTVHHREIEQRLGLELVRTTGNEPMTPMLHFGRDRLEDSAEHFPLEAQGRGRIGLATVGSAPSQRLPGTHIHRNRECPAPGPAHRPRRALHSFDVIGPRNAHLKHAASPRDAWMACRASKIFTPI